MHHMVDKVIDHIVDYVEHGKSGGYTDGGTCGRFRERLREIGAWMVDHINGSSHGGPHCEYWVAICTRIWEEMGTRMVDDMIDYAINR